MIQCLSVAAHTSYFICEVNKWSNCPSEYSNTWNVGKIVVCSHNNSRLFVEIREQEYPENKRGISDDLDGEVSVEKFLVLNKFVLRNDN